MRRGKCDDVHFQRKTYMAKVAQHIPQRILRLQAAGQETSKTGATLPTESSHSAKFCNVGAAWALTLVRCALLKAGSGKRVIGFLSALVPAAPRLLASISPICAGAFFFG